MPVFTYRGRSRTLVIAGRTLRRGVPTEITGRAAEAAANHPDIDKGKPKEATTPAPAPAAAALADIAAYLESGATDVGELTTKLVALDQATLAELAKEYELEADVVEGPVLNELAHRMLVPAPEAPTVDELMKLNREQLNAQATEAGVEKPEELPSKRDVASALLKAKGYSTGEGT